MDFELLIPIFAIVGFWAAIIIFIYMGITHRNKVRMALIQSGKDASIFKTPEDRKEQSLKIGMVTVGLGLGTLLGFALEMAGLPAYVSYTSMVLLLGGAGLIAYHQMQSKKAQMTEDVV